MFNFTGAIDTFGNKEIKGELVSLYTAELDHVESCTAYYKAQAEWHEAEHLHQASRKSLLAARVIIAKRFNVELLDLTAEQHEEVVDAIKGADFQVRETEPVDFLGGWR